MSTPTLYQGKPHFGFNTHGNVIPNLAEHGAVRHVTIIAALGFLGGIGKDNAMPWFLPKDMAQFKRLTQDHVVIMGRKTFESLSCKPLPNRLNIVLTRDIKFVDSISASYPDVICASNLPLALKYAGERQIFIIGGGEIYREALRYAHDMILTNVDLCEPYDTFFPPEADQHFDYSQSIFSSHQQGNITYRYAYHNHRIIPIEE